jgi:hypothetical protein
VGSLLPPNIYENKVTAISNNQINNISPVQNLTNLIRMISETPGILVFFIRNQKFRAFF